MAISTRALERLGIHEQPEEIEKLVVEAMEQMVSGRYALDPKQDLTSAEKDALSRGGLVLEEIDLGREDPLLRSSTEYAALVASSLTVHQVAGMLGVDDSRIRQRLANRTIYGIKLRAGWRIPLFQFAEGHLLPGIEPVLQQLAGDLHPLAVLHWFTQPNPDLIVTDTAATSPRDWLRSGRDPQVVAELASEL